MKKIFNIILVLGSGVVLTGCSSNVLGGDSLKVNVDAPNNIEVKTYVDYEDDYIYVYVKNNTSSNIDSFDVEGVFYDKKVKTVDLVVEVSDNNHYDDLYNNQVATSYEFKHERLYVTVKNNSGNDLRMVEVAVIFKKDGKVLDYDRMVNMLNSGEETERGFSIPDDWTEKDGLELIVIKAKGR